MGRIATHAMSFIATDFSFFFQQASRFNFRHIDMDSTQTEAKAMDDLREKIEKVFADDLAFPYSRFYLGWETNKVFIKVIRTNGCLMRPSFGLVIEGQNALALMVNFA